MATVDDSGRIQLPNCDPGDSFEISSVNPGILILRKMNAAHSDAVPVMHSTPRGALLVAAEPPPGPIDFGALMRRQRDEE